MRVPRFIRWLLVLVAVAAGWAAGNLLDAARAARESAAPTPPRHPPASRPASRPAAP